MNNIDWEYLQEHGYHFREFYIPPRMIGGLKRYIQLFIEPGNFLTAVLSNDLVSAVSHADDENIRNLPAYSAFLVNEAPISCWGSKEEVAAWKTQKEWKGKAKEIIEPFRKEDDRLAHNDPDRGKE